MTKSRAQLRGKPLDKDCYKARISTHEYGPNDNRKFCYDLMDLRTDDLCKECQSCNANVMNAQEPILDTKQLSKVIMDSIEEAIHKGPLLAFENSISTVNGKTIKRIILTCPSCKSLLVERQKYCHFCEQTIDWRVEDE